MPRRIAGIDGCKAGWVVVSSDIDDPAGATRVVTDDLDATLDAEGIELAVIDIPIGFSDGPGARDVEAAMRGFLKGKSSSVFNTPCRAAMHEATYFDASHVNAHHLGKRLTKQSFMLFPKMIEVDAVVARVTQGRLKEGHPEVSFAWLNGGEPVLSQKRKPAGQADRCHLLRQVGIDGDALLDGLRGPACGRDDVLDAAALMWTAGRVARNEHETYPAAPGRDAAGLEMSVVA